MKAVVISDIHSNVYALEAIRQAEPEYDAIYCAGDLVDYGPFPQQVIEWTQQHNVVCVRGNHDDIVIDVFRNEPQLAMMTGDERKWAHHNAQLLGEAEIRYLESLPLFVAFELDGYAYTMKHLYRDYLTIDSLPKFDEQWAACRPGDVNAAVGSATASAAGSTTAEAGGSATDGAPDSSAAEAAGSSVADAVDNNTKNRADANTSRGERRLVFGHTHRRCVHMLGDGALWLNPGSVSYRRPDDLSKEAHYATITDGRIELKRVAYDRAPLLEATHRTLLRADELRVAYVFFG